MALESEKRRIINGLKPHFEVTWENERKLVNTELSVFLLKPSDEIAQMFGFDKELPLFVSPYTTLQPRSMQAMEQICTEHPLSGRIDPTVALFSSPADNLVEWISQYQSENSESRILVPLRYGIFSSSVDDRWKLINCIKDVLFIRNLFDYKLPLKSDRFFYGREDVVAALIDNIKKSQNSALFGLRKTGKTSVLLKVQRSLLRADGVHTLLFDCKSRPIRSGSCDDLARRIVEFIDRKFSKKYLKSESNGVDVFDVLESAIKSLPSKSRLCVIFDEIEYISPISPTDAHWQKDFIDLWQALWSIQSRCDKLVFIVCGVNPTVCEMDRFKSYSIPDRMVQNPMFSIFNVYTLRGLDLRNLKSMIKFFGSRMGLFFLDDAIENIFEEYGGHPLLSRLACSFHHQLIMSKSASRPVSISADDLIETCVERDSELSSYCGHVISEVAELYPNEYQLLKLLASGEVSDFLVLASKQDEVRHIRDYGLVAVEPGRVPTFKIPVVSRYLRISESKSIAMDEEKRFPSITEMKFWLAMRAKSLVDDLILLHEERKDRGLFTIYENKYMLKVHNIRDSSVVASRDDAVSFLVHAHKYIVEPVDKNIQGGVARNFDFISMLPNLQKSFMRLKYYRNMYCHVDVNPATERGFLSFIKEDFDGVMPDAVARGWFKLQRRVLDGIHVALQAEIAAL